MQKKKLISAALAATLLVGSVQASQARICYPKAVGGGSSSAVAPWIVIGCAGGVILAALAANYRDGRELTAQEAWSCGLLFLASQPRHHRRHRG
jgi:hypothetical protein